MSDGEGAGPPGIYTDGTLRQWRVSMSNRNQMTSRMANALMYFDQEMLFKEWALTITYYKLSRVKNVGPGTLADFLRALKDSGFALKELPQEGYVRMFLERNVICERGCKNGLLGTKRTREQTVFCSCVRAR